MFSLHVSFIEGPSCPGQVAAASLFFLFTHGLAKKYVPSHPTPCQKKKKKMQVDGPYCSIPCVMVSCVCVYLWFHFEFLLLEIGTVLCFFVSFQSNIFKDTDDTCLLNWNKRTSLPSLKRLASLSSL